MTRQHVAVAGSGVAGLTAALVIDDVVVGGRGSLNHVGLDDTFQRMRHFHPACCEAGFAARYSDDNQLTLVKEVAP